MAPIAWHYCFLEFTGENCVKTPSWLQAHTVVSNKQSCTAGVHGREKNGYIQIHKYFRLILDGEIHFYHKNKYNLPALCSEPFVIFIKWLYIAINLTECLNFKLCLICSDLLGVWFWNLKQIAAGYTFFFPLSLSQNLICCCSPSEIFARY